MRNYKQQLLNAFLDKYERSKSFKEDASKGRRIMIKLYDNGHSEFKAYNIENAEIKDAYNRAIHGLKAASVVNYEWMKYEDGNIIARVWLVLELLEDAYTLADRKPKLVKVSEMLDLIAAISQGVTSEWVSKYYQSTYSSIEKKRSITGDLPEDAELACDVLKAIKMIDSLQHGETLERAFSLRCFGDSKRFEKAVKARVVGIVRRFCVDDPDGELSDEDVLRQVGIIKAPEIVDFCGSVTVTLDTGV